MSIKTKSGVLPTRYKATSKGQARGAFGGEPANRQRLSDWAMSVAGAKRLSDIRKLERLGFTVKPKFGKMVEPQKGWKTI